MNSDITVPFNKTIRTDMSLDRILQITLIYTKLLNNGKSHDKFHQLLL